MESQRKVYCIVKKDQLQVRGGVESFLFHSFVKLPYYYITCKIVTFYTHLGQFTGSRDTVQAQQVVLLQKHCSCPFEEWEALVQATFSLVPN